MAIELATRYLPYVDEMFTTESKKSLLTNQDFSWTGAKSVKVYRVSTSQMNDYDRPGTAANWSRYGEVESLNATTQSMTLRRDRSFTFAIDRLDTDETKQQLQAASALARQLREIVIPEVDTWVYKEMCENAGLVGTSVALTASNVFEEILKASNAMDNEEVPETGRILVVNPDVYTLMKKSKDIIMETDISNDLRIRGVVAMIDGAMVIKVPAIRLPQGIGFMMAHPVATVAPVKLEDYTIHDNPPGISGALVEGRINYDAFVLDNKAKAIYYLAQA